ncbi:hypothetical protein ACX8Z9_09135 [Arthrobacter halodurans]|uniref:Uncharacterized protein n=1 Tax=Arthrobacter halodurans TaxID=516699 RepID=A0ABV4UL32_9MICC
MSDGEKVRGYLSWLSGEVEGILAGLPYGVHGTTRIRDNHVYAEIKGPRLGTFTLVLGSEAPEIVYDGLYIRHDLIGGEPEDQTEFAKESVDAIVYFLLSGRVPVKRKSPVFKRPYLSVPMAGGDEWRMKEFR